MASQATTIKTETVCVTDDEIAEKKKHMRGKARHDPNLTKTHHQGNLNKYDIFVTSDANLSQSAYNTLCKFGREQRRFDEGRGKWK